MGGAILRAAISLYFHNPSRDAFAVPVRDDQKLP
jgi:hypothetical protein